MGTLYRALHAKNIHDFTTWNHLEQSRATWPVKWYISTAVLPSLPADSQSEMMLTSHYDLSYLVSDGK